MCTHRRLFYLASRVVSERRRHRVVSGDRVDNLLFALGRDWGSMANMKEAGTAYVRNQGLRVAEPSAGATVTSIDLLDALPAPLAQLYSKRVLSSRLPR